MEPTSLIRRRRSLLDAFRHQRRKIGSTRAYVNETPFFQPEVTVTKYAARHWAVWSGKELIAVTLYKKGAARVAELLREKLPNLPLKSSPELEGDEHLFPVERFRK